MCPALGVLDGTGHELATICGVCLTQYEEDQCPSCHKERERAKRVMEKRRRREVEGKDRLIRDVEERMTRVCVNCGTENPPDAAICSECGMGLSRAPTREEYAKSREVAERARSVVLTTGFEVQGRAIVEYIDVVTCEVVMGTGFLTELLGYGADVLGTRSDKFEQKLQQAKDEAVRGLRLKAADLGAGAVIGVDIDYMNIAQNMLMVVASGTAVRLG